MKKFKKKEIIALAVIAVLIIAVIIAGIVIITGNVNEANNKLNNTTATDEVQLETQIITDAEGNTEIVGIKTHQTEAESGTEKTDNKETNSQTTATSANNNSNSNSNNSDKSNNTATKNDSNSSNTTDDNKNNGNSDEDKDYDNNISGDTGEVDVIIPETKPVEKDEDVLTINGTKCNVGNTITVTLNVKTPVVLENYQGFTEYDGNYLEFVSVKGNVSGLFNDHENAIYYNGSDIGAGYDFTDNGTLYTATFKVLKAGSTKINNTVEVMSDKNSKPVDLTKCEFFIGIFN